MTADRSNLASLAFFVCGVGYTLWPASDTPVAKAARGDAPIKLKDRWFNPKLGPASPRDPFVPQGPVERKAETKPTATAAVKAATTAAPARPAIVRVPQDAVGLKLSAILIGPNGSAAVLDGRVVSVGDRMKSSPNAKTSADWEIARVLADRVDVVDYAGKRFASLTLELDEKEKTAANAPGSTRPGTGRPSPAAEPTTAVDDREQLRMILGPAASSMSPLPPGIAENLGRLIGADLKSGNLGALESFLGSGSNQGPNASPVMPPKGGR